MKIESLDHLVLTVADIQRTCAFYEAVLAMQHVETEGRHALNFGAQKINLHQMISVNGRSRSVGRRASSGRPARASGAAGFHRRALSEPDVNLSAHPAPGLRLSGI